MPVAGNEDRPFAFGECEQIIVVRIGGAGADWVPVGSNARSAPQKLDEGRRVGRADAAAQLRVGKRLLQFRKKFLRDDELELAAEPAREDLRRCPAGREERRYENVDVKDSAHSASAAAPGLVLSLERKLKGLILAEITALPQ